MNKKQLIVVWLLVALLISNFCYSEDSDLKEIVDSQSNVYSIDEEGRIYSEGIPHDNRQPASVENIGYYFNESVMLDITGHLKEAMQMYYEILSLPDADESVITAKDGIRARIEVWYDNDETRNLVLMYFDVKKLGEENYEITPRAKIGSK